MTRYEQHAWFNLAVLFVTLVAFGILLTYFELRGATAAFGLLGLWGLGPLFFFVQGGKQVITDERDEAIRKTASQVAFGFFWLYFVASCMSLWATHLKEAMISVDVLPLLVLAGWMVFILVHALSTLVQYRRPNLHAA